MKKLPIILGVAAIPIAATVFFAANSAPQQAAQRDDSVSITQRHAFSEIAGTKQGGKKPQAKGRLRVGEAAPELAFQDLGGQTRSLQDWRGKLALVMLADTTCPCVRAYDKRMKALAQKFTELRVLYAFSSPVESRAQVQKFVAARGYAWPVVHDPQQALFAALGGHCTTESFLFDSGGVLRYHGRIDDNIYDEANVQVRDLENAIKSVRNGQNFVKTEVPAYGCVIPRVAQSRANTGKGKAL